MEVPVPVLALAPAADSLRPIHVYTYAPTPAGAKPQLPAALVDLFLDELSREPHHNPFYCNRCAREYILAVRAEGTTCTQRSEGGFVCTGVITRRWTKEKAQDELRRLMGLGCVAIAWELGHSSVHVVALAVCEAHCSKSVIHAIGFPMTVLGTIYGKFGRDEPFLVITHLSVVGIAHAQRAVMVEKLVKDAVESMMGLHHLLQATVLIPVSTQEHSPERQALDMMCASKQVVLVRDARNDRNRELWGFRLRSR